MEIPQEVLDKVKDMEVDKHPGAICIANYKGGVGKTTMTTLIGYYLAKKGNRVLLIDIDAQCSLSLAVGFDLNKIQSNDYNIENLVSPNKWSKINKLKLEPYVSDIPDIYAPSTLKIIKGSFEVDDLDLKIARTVDTSERAFMELCVYCRQVIYSFKDQFHYVLVDCPPNKMYLTQAMLRACPYFLAVTIPDRISTFGVPRLKRWINDIEEDVRPKLLGCILNAVNRAGGNEFGTANQQLAEQELKSSIGSVLKPEERKTIGNQPVLSHIPRLDVVSKFLSQGDEKKARFDFDKSKSDQRTVNEVMMNLINRIEKRIEKYAKT